MLNKIDARKLINEYVVICSFYQKLDTICLKVMSESLFYQILILNAINLKGN